jgi:hypothetical protein
VIQKYAYSGDILQAMNALKEGGVLKKWGAELEKPYDRRNVFLGDLKRVGVLNPSGIGVASIRKWAWPDKRMTLGFTRQQPLFTSVWTLSSELLVQEMTRPFCSPLSVSPGKLK